MGYKNFPSFQKFDGGDVDENLHFIFRKTSSSILNDLLKNLMGRCWWKSSFYWRKMSRTWPKIQYFKNFDHKMAIFFSHITKFRKSHNIFFIWNIFVKNNNFWINLFGTIWWKIVRKMFVKINFETFQFSWKIYSGRYETCLSK